MDQLHEMNTLSDIMNRLRLKGFDNEIKMSDTFHMTGSKNNKVYAAGDLTIIKIFRFEGDSDPADNAALYITQDKDGELGYILDAYGVYSTQEDNGFDEFLKSIPVVEIDIHGILSN
jgi:hypothetical protein